MHVVERVETYDRISHNRFMTRYAYHHGYFDGIERELAASAWWSNGTPKSLPLSAKARSFRQETTSMNLRTCRLC